MLKNTSLATRSAPACRGTRLANAASISPPLLAFKTAVDQQLDPFLRQPVEEYANLTYSPLWGGGKANCLAGAGRHEWPRRLFRRGTWSMGGHWSSRDGLYRGDPSPVVYGPVGISAAAMWRIKVASGQAAAKARRTRDAISITRAPSFKSRRRMVLNSAVASACVLGIASRSVSISQYAAVCRMSRIWLARGLRQLVRSEALQNATRWPCGIAIGTQHRKPATESPLSTIAGLSPSTKAPGRGPCRSRPVEPSGAGPKTSAAAGKMSTSCSTPKL